MTIAENRRALDGLASRLFRRDHPGRPWRGETSASASSEERLLYRGFAAGLMRRRLSAAGGGAA